MPWVKLDEAFYDHPKVLAAGPLAAWLYVCGLGYCNRHLTDGFIANAVVRRLADVDDAPHLAAQLVDVGLWELTDGGYVVHDFLDYQTSKDQAEEVSQVRAEAGRRGGAARAKQTPSKPEANAKQIASGLLPHAPSKPEANAKQIASGASGEMSAPARPHVSVRPDPDPDPESLPNGSDSARTRPDLRKPKDKEKGQVQQHPLFPVIDEFFGPIIPSRWSAIAKNLHDLDALGATPDDLRYRATAYPAVMGVDPNGKPFARTLPALINNWQRCAPPAVNGRARAPTEPPPRSKAETAELRRRILAGEEIE